MPQNDRPGAGTVVGTQFVVKSPPDGYTMVVGGVGSIAGSMVVGVSLGIVDEPAIVRLPGLVDASQSPVTTCPVRAGASCASSFTC